VGCGLGHLTWATGQRSPRADTVGVDPDFLSLLYAQSRVAPRAAFVCADARALPFRAQTFTLALSSDVLPYITEKRTVVQEMERVLTDDGTMLLTALRNSLAVHVHGGEPLSPTGWLALVDHLEHQLFADPDVLSRYLQRRPPTPVSVSSATAAQTLSIIASRLPIVAEETFDEWPHSRGTLAVHPLLRVSSSRHDRGVEYTRSAPSATYERDHPLLTTYLPERLSLAPAGVDQARSGRVGPELEAALACVAVLGVPDGLVVDPWPGFAVSTAP
jgi:SAM-dependent methyltransferase